jgi:hypothetical protein
MPVTILGDLVDDSDIVQSERVVDMDNEIAMLDKDNTQFTTMLMRVSSKPAISSKVEWLEDELFPRLDTLSVSASNSMTQLLFSNPSYFRVGDVVRLAASGEAVTITAAANGASIGVTRSTGAVAAASVAAGSDAVIIGNAAAQGASLGKRAVTKRVAQYNYTQIFRHPYGFTETLAASKLYGGNEPMKERRKKAIEHKRAIELALFWGARELYTGGTEPQGIMGGLFEFISTNVLSGGGATSASEWEQFLRTAYAKGSTNKVAFVAPIVASIVSGYAQTNWVQSRPTDHLWGVKVDTTYSGAYGYGLPVVVKRDWNDFQTTVLQFGAWAFFVDMDSVTYRPLRPTRLLLNRQAPSEDQQVEEYLTECSFQVEHERHHSVAKDITS